MRARSSRRTDTRVCHRRRHSPWPWLNTFACCSEPQRWATSCSAWAEWRAPGRRDLSDALELLADSGQLSLGAKALQQPLPTKEPFAAALALPELDCLHAEVARRLGLEELHVSAVRDAHGFAECLLAGLMASGAPECASLPAERLTPLHLRADLFGHRDRKIAVGDRLIE